MQVSDFLVCTFKNSSTTYVAEIIEVDDTAFKCRFVQSGHVYTFNAADWTVLSSDSGGFKNGTPLDSHSVYTRSDNPSSIVDGPVCVTFADGKRYLGNLTTDEAGLKYLVTFIHSGSKYEFDFNNNIVNSTGLYKAGDKINGMEAYIAPPATADFADEPVDITVKPGTLSTDWNDYFQSFTDDMMQDSIKAGTELLKPMLTSCVSAAKAISHSIENPVDGKDLLNDTLEGIFNAVTGDEEEALLDAGKVFIGLVVGTVADFIKANQAGEVASKRRKFYDAYIYGCLSAMKATVFTAPDADTIEKNFFDLGFNSVKKFGASSGMQGDATVANIHRGDLLAALVESFRLRPGVLDETYTIDDYKRALNDNTILYNGFMSKFQNSDDLTGD